MGTERNKGYRNLLESKGRDELRTIAKRLKIARFSKLSKNGLITAILDADPTGKAAKPITWWNRYHNHVYGIAGLVGLLLTIIFFILGNFQNKLSGLQNHLPSVSPQSPVTSD